MDSAPFYQKAEWETGAKNSLERSTRIKEDNTHTHTHTTVFLKKQEQNWLGNMGLVVHLATWLLRI